MTRQIDLIQLTVKPKYIAQRCPVCNGWGTVSNQRITCHACQGKGYITIPLEQERDTDYANNGK